ncbi:MAG TPA: aminoglycoside adenylyltransferase domain-containing protein, partial [Anaerolineales bacterium]|nr:aminoglycoside adenylyltransferase domain-containing protein [Anaerolineales bacterium]
SDIDFVTVLNRRLTPRDTGKLQSIHQELEKNFPQWKMLGSYIQPGDLGKLDGNIQPHPHYHDGVLHQDGHNELNAVTWWELKHHGIAVVGIEPQNLSFTLDWNVLITEMMENLNTYWAGWTSRPVRIVMLYSDWGIQWAVTGILRQFYTFRENTITTKIRAAEYALGCLPKRWHPLIQEAINIRQKRSRSTYWFRIARTFEAVNFLRFIIQTCNAKYPQK